MMYKHLEERYMNDSDFNFLVNALQEMIRKCKFTPSEVKDAATLACILFELENPECL